MTLPPKLNCLTEAVRQQRALCRPVQEAGALPARCEEISHLCPQEEALGSDIRFLPTLLYLAPTNMSPSLRIHVLFPALRCPFSTAPWPYIPQGPCSRPTASSFQNLTNLTHPRLTFRGDLRVTFVWVLALTVTFPGSTMGSGSTVRLLITTGSFPSSQFSQEKLLNRSG